MRQRAEERVGVLQGRWRLNGPMAQGAQAAVHSGVDLETGGAVVIKALRPAGGRSGRRPTDLLRLRHEAEALAQLDHPCFVRLLHAGTEVGRTWLVMERAPGKGVNRCIKAGELPDARTAALAAAELADGLHRAHASGLLHRDIKPSNLVWDGARLRLVDWGLARVRGLHEDIDEGLMLGTLPYMAMEAWGLGGPTDERTDLYALGAALYEWMCGDVAFPGSGSADVLQAHRAGSVDDPCRLRPEIPRALGDVVLRSIRRDAGERYQTARGLAADLRRAAEAAPGRTIPLGSNDHPGVRRSDAPFVGRADEARRVLDATAAAAHGRGGVLLVEGAPGDGRTRFLHEVAEPLRRRGALVLTARCASFEQTLPLDPIVQAFAHLRATLPTLPSEARSERVAALRATLDGRAGGLLGLVPSLCDVLPDAAPCEPRMEPLRDALLGTALPGRPTVLIIDDAHRADPASQELLVALARSLAGAPFVLVLSAPAEAEGGESLNTSSLNEPAKDFLVRVMLAAGRQVDRIRLRGFGLDAVERWLDGALGEGDRDLAEWLHEQTEGNPRRLGELLGAAIDGGALAPTPGGWRWDARRAERLELDSGSGPWLARRLDQSGLRVRRTLAATALIAPEVGFDEVAAVVGAFGISRQEVAKALTSAEVEGVLVAAGSRLRFRHSSVRRALAAQWPDAARSPLHRRAGQVLQGDRAAEDLEDRLLFAVGHHALKDGSGCESVPLLRTAAARARGRGDAATAADFARAAADRSSCVERAESLVELAEAELMRGRLAAARHVAKAARLASPGAEGTGAARAIEAEAAELSGRLADAEAAARAGLEALGQRVPEGALQRAAAGCWALVRWTLGRRGRAAAGGAKGRLLRVATRLAAARGAPEAAVLVMVSLAEAKRSGSRTDEALALGGLALGVAERTGAREVAGAMLARAGGRGPAGAWITGCRGVLALLDGRPREARRLLEEGVAGLRAAGCELEARQLLGALALAARDGGDLSGLRRSLQGDADRDPRLRGWSLVVSAWLTGLGGETRRARDLATAAVECARELGDEPLEALALARRAEVGLRAGVLGAAEEARAAVAMAGSGRSMLALEARVIAAAVLVAAGEDGAAVLPPSRHLRGTRGLRWKAARVRALAGGRADELRALARQAEDDGRWWDAASVWLGAGLEEFEDKVAGMAALRWCRGVAGTSLAQKAEGGAAERRLEASAQALVLRLRLRDDAAISQPGDQTVVWESGTAAARG
jgi:tRNA A-37 threonylcarbamoyl transferase component Bud32